MIQASNIRLLADTFLEGTSGFVVDVRVKEGNVISILLDDDSSTSISDCMALSRHLEDVLDREAEDFALDVSSPGLDQPLKMHRQYLKNRGREVQVKVSNAGKIEGVLIQATETDLTLRTREKKRIEGRKAREWVETDHNFALNELDWTKVQVSFKPKTIV